ncbi:MAG: hypothetical protein NTZ40_04465 [Cyanobacteria bacterium]|nr:hypothetical protein [Cyanobacteriota bacterium]
MLLADGATIGILRSDVRAFKYLLHLVLINPALSLRPSGHDGWTPMRYSVVGAIAVRLDYGGAQILGHSIQNFDHKHWMRLCSHLGIFHRVLDQLALQPQQRALAEWDSENHSYSQRNIWLQYHWQWLRIREENPNLTTLTISLSEAVAADKAKTAERNALKVAADATKALGNRRVTGVGY